MDGVRFSRPGVLQSTVVTPRSVGRGSVRPRARAAGRLRRLPLPPPRTRGSRADRVFCQGAQLNSFSRRVYDRGH